MFVCQNKSVEMMEGNLINNNEESPKPSKKGKWLEILIKK